MPDKRTANRRRGPDTLVKAINTISMISWVIVFIVFIIISFAKPKMETLFDRKYHVTLSHTWDKTTLQYAIFLLVMVVLVCAAGIAINSVRHRRKTDRYNKSLIFFGAGSLLGILYYLIFV